MAYDLSQYAIRGTMITSPGKFQNEPIYSPYFYDHADDGEVIATQGDNDAYVSILTITKEDHEQFPDMLVDPYVIVIETSDGFVHCMQASEDDCERMRRSYSTQDETN